MVLAQDLRNAVLQAAFCGNLTKQLCTDTDIHITLDAIKLEKKALVIKKKVRDDIDFPEIDEHEKTFLIPENWGWVRIGDVGVYKKGPFGSTLTKSIFIPKSYDSVKVYEQKNAIQKDFSLGDYYISRDYYESKMKSFTVESGDIIVSCAGTIGETYTMPDNIELGIINQALMRMNIVDSINIDYFLKYFDHILKEDTRKKSKGSAIKNIPPFDIFKKLLIPLPPIEEQQRIVDRVNELMERIDDYEKVEKELVDLENKFPDDMKNAFLQAAMQGKLTEQLETDCSVDEMLEIIKEEKKKLIKEKKIKKEKVLSPIEEASVPFDIPSNWRWEKLGNISAIVTKGTTPRGGNIAYVESGIGFLRAENIAGLDKLELKDMKYIDQITNDTFLNRSILKAYDLLITIAGTLGRTAIVREQDLPLNANQAISIIRLVNLKLLNLEYLVYAINSPLIHRDLIGEKRVTAIPNLTLGIISNCLIPLSPIEEQQRIVEKLEHLLSLCETL